MVAAGCGAGIRHGERLEHSGRALQPRCRGFFGQECCFLSFPRGVG
jgi:hypothetical protein